MLPLRVQHRSISKPAFVFWQLVSALPGLAVGLGPSALLWFFLAPSGFFQRLITLGCCGVLFIPFGIGGFFLYATISEKTTGF